MSETEILPVAECQLICELFADPSRFCTGTFARNSSGNPVDPRDPSAVQWCLAGAWALIYGVVAPECPRKRLMRLGASAVLDGLCASNVHKELITLVPGKGWDLSELNDALSYDKLYELIKMLGI